MTARLLLLLALLLLPRAGLAAGLPRIVASADNPVPKYVAPAALMDFAVERNAQRTTPRAIEPRFTNLAALYQRIGRCVPLPPAQWRARLRGAGRQQFRRRRRHGLRPARRALQGRRHRRARASATRLDVFDRAPPRSGRPAHASSAGRRAGHHAQIAPAGDLRRSGARMDRHRPQHLRRGNAEAVGEIRGELLPRTGAQRTRTERSVSFVRALTSFFLAHDLIRKPVPPFRDHAL